MAVIACSIVWKTFTLLVITVLPVVVKTSSGESLRGNVGGFTDSALVLKQSEKTIELRFRDLASLRPVSVATKTGPTFRIVLTNGSQIAAQDVSLWDDVLVIEPRRQMALRIPVKWVAAIRFRAAAATTDAAWLGIVDQQSRGDKMVIRRTGDVLDPQPGIIESIKKGKVAFNLDGDTVKAPIDRLEGVVFGAAGTSDVTSEIRVSDVYGSQWVVRSIGASDGDEPLQLQLIGGLEHEIPLDQIESIHWSGGVQMLASQKPASSSFQQYFKTNLKDDLLESFFSPKADQDSDLVMQGSSSIEYRIEEGYRVLAGSMLRKKSVRKAGKTSVIIELDGKEVWREQLTRARPLGFELPLEDSRRLTIRVDGGGDGDLGDTVHITRPRLLK